MGNFAEVFSWEWQKSEHSSTFSGFEFLFYFYPSSKKRKKLEFHVRSRNNGAAIICIGAMNFFFFFFLSFETSIYNDWHVRVSRWASLPIQPRGKSCHFSLVRFMAGNENLAANETCYRVQSEPQLGVFFWRASLRFCVSVERWKM